MKLANYISDLLYRYDCVIIPTFGGFVTNQKSARIDAFSNTFYPPYKQISFNSQLTDNDGLLANYIASTDNMKYECALNYIKFEIEEWKKKLKTQDIDIDAIGTISEVNDKLIFEPSDKVNFLTSSFGLSDFTCREVKREELKKQVVELEQKAPITFTPESKKAPNYLKYAAAFIIGISAIGFGGKLYRDYQENQMATIIETEQNALEQKIEKATFEISKPLPAIKVEITAQKKNYHVIAGAFRYPENANVRVEQLKAAGFNARILGVNKWGLTIVSFDSFKTREESEIQLEQIQRNEEKDAWILYQEL
ncbi:MAG: SPOR domain-containing protein [Lutimonas sp.]